VNKTLEAHPELSRTVDSPNAHETMTPPPATRMRVALVGCGAVARENLLPVLAGHDRLLLGPLIDRDEARARDLADAYGVSSVATDLDRVSRDQIDAVVLATPPAHHAPATIACAQRGWHVFVEKPMAIRAVDAQAMVDAAERAGVVLSVGLYRRFLPAVVCSSISAPTSLI
jgi:predicted dehydrogenase